MDLKVQAFSDVGRQRTQNQDRVVALPRWGVFALSDGIGGKPGGEVASQMIVDAVEARAESMARAAREYDATTLEGREEVFSVLFDEVQAINAAVYEAGRDEAFPRGIGATLDLVVFGPHGAYILHVGDSRVYLFRRGEVYRITQDHTFAEHLRANPDLRGHGEPRLFSHILTRSIGREPRVEPDRLYVELIAGDRCLMCSDGITDYFTGQQLLELLREADEDRLAQHLVDAANAAGGKDNASALIVELGNEFGEEFERGATTQPDTLRRLNFMHQIELFDALGMQETLKLLRYVITESVASGDVVIRQGDPVDGLYLIMDGELEVRRGEESLGRLGEGGHFGEVGLFGAPVRSADVVCRKPGHLLLLRTENLRRLVEEEPELGTKILWRLLEQAAGLIQKLSAQANS